MHHFPTKDALILEATEYLMRRAYRVLGNMLLAIVEDENRLQAVVDGAWSAVYGTPAFAAYFELITAARHDTELARAMQTLSQRPQSMQVWGLRSIRVGESHEVSPRRAP